MSRCVLLWFFGFRSHPAALRKRIGSGACEWVTRERGRESHAWSGRRGEWIGLGKRVRNRAFWKKIENWALKNEKTKRLFSCLQTFKSTGTHTWTRDSVSYREGEKSMWFFLSLEKTYYFIHARGHSWGAWTFTGRMIFFRFWILCFRFRKIRIFSYFVPQLRMDPYDVPRRFVRQRWKPPWRGRQWTAIFSYFSFFCWKSLIFSSNRPFLLYIWRIFLDLEGKRASLPKRLEWRIVFFFCKFRIFKKPTRCGLATWPSNCRWFVRSPFWSSACCSCSLIFPILPSSSSISFVCFASRSSSRSVWTFISVFHGVFRIVLFVIFSFSKKISNLPIYILFV